MWQWMNGNSWAGELYRQLVCVCVCLSVCPLSVCALRFRSSSYQNSLSGHSAEITAVLPASLTGLFLTCPPWPFFKPFLFPRLWILKHNVLPCGFLYHRDSLAATAKGGSEGDEKGSRTDRWLGYTGDRQRQQRYSDLFRGISWKGFAPLLQKSTSKRVITQTLLQLCQRSGLETSTFFNDRQVINLLQ